MILSPQNLYVGTATPNVTVFENKDLKEIVKVK